MASHAVATCATTPCLAPRCARERGRGGGRPNARGSCLGRDRFPTWRCLPTPSRDPLARVRASPGSCDLYDVSDDLTPYAVAWGWQKAILDARLAALSAERDGNEAKDPSSTDEAETDEALPLGARDCLLLVQHPAVVTLGTGSTPDNLKFDPEDPSAPFEVHRTERGGEATYHGPGQIVLYPILDLNRRRPDLHWYMRALEEVAILAMEDLGVRYAGRVEGLTGAWANVRDDEDVKNDESKTSSGGARVTENGEVASTKKKTKGNTTPLGAREHKVAAIGVRARRWVTYHGMAFNVDPDLGDFRHIVPCGIGDKPVGSVKQLLAGEAGVVSSAFGSVMGADENGRGACGGGAFAVDADAGPDPDLMRRAKKALLCAFEEVFETKLTRRGGAPPV